MPGELAADGTVLASPAAESRTHFGAWAVVSAPLVLGLALTPGDAKAQAALDAVWDIITNREVIAVSQTWQGLPGALVREWQAANVPTLVNVACPAAPAAAADAHTWTVLASALAAGDDLQAGVYSLAEAEAWCGASAACVGFTYAGAVALTRS